MGYIKRSNQENRI